MRRFASDWYAVLCKPRREAVAEENLLKQGFRVYLPRLLTERRRGGRWIDAIEPLFPRYLFIAAGDERQSFAPVRSTKGVASMVSFGGQAAIVPPAVIAALKAREDPASGACERKQPFSEGQTIAFRSGPFAGLDGVFDMEAGEDRVFVLLELLGKLNRVKVDRNWLVPAV